MILMERLRLQTLAGVSMSTITAAVSRGRLDEAEAFELIQDGDGRERPGRLVRGVTLESARAYWNWSLAAVDEILADHGLSPDADDVLLKAIYTTDVVVDGAFRSRLYLANSIRPVPRGADDD